MPTLNVFVSFEFDKDNNLKNNFYEQARKRTQHRIRNCSLREEYPDEYWKRKAREAIEDCDLVVVLSVRTPTTHPCHNGNGHGSQPE